MNEFQVALLLGAVFVAVVSSNLPRSNLWIAAGAASFIASTAWSRYGMPFPPAFTMGCDALVCLAIYFLARERWEEWLYRVFQASTLISLVYLAGPIEIGSVVITMSHWLYVVTLEIANWAALLLIGGTALLEWSREHEDSADRPWNMRLLRARNFGRSARAKNPFTHQVTSK